MPEYQHLFKDYQLLCLSLAISAQRRQNFGPVSPVMCNSHGSQLQNRVSTAEAGSRKKEPLWGAQTLGPADGLPASSWLLGRPRVAATPGSALGSRQARAQDARVEGMSDTGMNVCLQTTPRLGPGHLSRHSFLLSTRES